MNIKNLVITHGKYYNPANLHYDSDKTVFCDFCKKENLANCIGYQNYDLCLVCANLEPNLNIITILSKFSIRKIYENTSEFNIDGAIIKIENNIISMTIAYNNYTLQSTSQFSNNMTKMQYLSLMSNLSTNKKFIYGFDNIVAGILNDSWSRLMNKIMRI